MSPAEAAVAALSAHPLMGMAIVIGVYALTARLHEYLGGYSLTHPLALSILALTLVFGLNERLYGAFFASAELLHIALAPAFALLAVPLWRHRGLLMRNLAPVAAALVVGGGLSVAAGHAVGLAMATTPSVAASLSLKSATTAASAPAAAALGADPSLTAGVVILTGLVGGLIGPPFLRAIGVRDPRALGVALGVGAHGLGVARSFGVSAVSGAFASLAMILNALFTVKLAAALAW